MAPRRRRLGLSMHGRGAVGEHVPPHDAGGRWRISTYAAGAARALGGPGGVSWPVRRPPRRSRLDNYRSRGAASRGQAESSGWWRRVRGLGRDRVQRGGRRQRQARAHGHGLLHDSRAAGWRWQPPRPSRVRPAGRSAHATSMPVLARRAIAVAEPRRLANADPSDGSPQRFPSQNPANRGPSHKSHVLPVPRAGRESDVHPHFRCSTRIPGRLRIYARCEGGRSGCKERTSDRRRSLREGSR